MSYSYCDRNLLENPEKYNFTKFQGKDFLIDYFNFRQKQIKKIENKININLNMDKIISELEVKKDSIQGIFLLENFLIEIIVGKNRNEKINVDIDRFLKKFEVKKKLAESYTINFIENDTEYGNLKNYLLLGFLVTLRYNETRNLKYLNVLLKINDMLITQIEQLKDEKDFFIFKKNLENEIDYVKKICEKKGIEI